MTSCACGTSVSSLPSSGAANVVRESDVVAITALFNGQLDFVRCDAGCEVALRPTVVFHALESERAWVFAGDHVDSYALDHIVREAIDGPVAGVEIVGELDRLRTIVAEILRSRIAEVAPALELGVGPVDTEPERLVGGYSRDDLQYLYKYWRGFTPSVWAAIAVATLNIVPSLLIGEATDPADDPPQRQSVEERIQPFALLQAIVWISMLEAWGRHDVSGRNFEDDLRDYVDSPPVLGRSVGLLEDHLRRSGPPEDFTDLIGRYQDSAVRASLHIRSGPVESVTADWACSFLLLEVMRRTGEVSDTDNVLPRVMLDIDRVRRLTHPLTLYEAKAVVLHWHLDGGKITPRTAAAVAAMDSVLDEFGYTELAGPIPGLELDVPVDQLADVLLGMLDRGSSPAALEPLTQPLVDAHRAGDLARVVAAMAATATDPDVHEIRIWHATRLAQMHRPAAVLTILKDAFGEAITPADLNGDARPLVLAVTALRQLNLRTAATRMLDAADGQPVAEPDDELNLAVLRARLTREAGAPLRALRQLEEAYERDHTPSPPLLESLSMTNSRFGMHTEAIRYGLEALEIATIDPARQWNTARYAAQLMLVQAQARQTPSVEHLRRVQRIDRWTDPLTVLIGALAAFQGGLADTDWAAHEFLFDIYEDVDLLLTRSEDDHDPPSGFLALLFHARFSETYFTSRARTAWVRLGDYMLRHGLGNNAELLLRLAAHAIAAREVTQARPLLREALVAVASTVGDIATFEAGMNSGEDLAPAVAALASTAMLDQPPRRWWQQSRRWLGTADIRMIAELGRGITARQLSLHGLPDLERQMKKSGLDDTVVARLAPPTGRVAVIEWFTADGHNSAILTTIDHRGNVNCELRPMPDIHLPQLAKRWGYRISNWHAGRRGDPFEMPGWHDLSAWMTNLISEHLTPGDHLLIIPHRDWGQLPWHVIAGRSGLTSSYEPSWTAALSSVSEAPPRYRQWREGVAVVPRIADPPAVTESMHRFVNAVRQRATNPIVCAGVDCDRAALDELLESVDMAAVLCHGFTSADDSTIAFMIAAGGVLPLAHSVAANSTVGRRHRFGWRDSARLARAPKVLFSTACSTAATYVVGAGDHVGFYNALRPLGLRTYIAPQWDVVAEDTLSVVARAMKLFAGGGSGLAACLSKASDEAIAAGIPEWSARSLTLNGDWR